MSNLDPSSSAQINNANAQQARLETALRIAGIMSEASARLLKVQTDAANAAFAENSKQLTTLLKSLSTTDAATIVAEWTNLYQANMRRVLDVTRSCFEILPQAHSEVAKLVGDPLASAHKETQRYLDQFTTAISETRAAAAATMSPASSAWVGGTSPRDKQEVA